MSTRQRTDLKGVLVAVKREFAPDLWDQHLAIIKEHGECWFGKFAWEYKGAGKAPVPLEPHGEFYAGRPGATKVPPKFLRYRSDFVREINSVTPPLIIIDPDSNEYWTANIKQAEYIDCETRPFELGGIDPKLVPAYYFRKKDRADLKYHCCFWFRISGLTKLKKPPTIVVPGQWTGPINFHPKIGRAHV